MAKRSTHKRERRSIPGAGSEKSPSHIVVLVHGIRTQAPWAEMVQQVLDEQTSVDLVIPFRYGYFNVFRFISPLFTRRGPIELLARELRDIKKQYPDARISLIAHSYGTFAITKVLEDETDIVLFRLILCGSIVPQEFRWDKSADQVQSRILNDCGTRDVWPILATFVTWGFGPSGTFGFTSNRVRSRFHNFKHSDFFDKSFVEKYWTSYIDDGEITGSEWEKERLTPPWWQSLMTIIKLPVIVLLVALATFAWTYLKDEKDSDDLHAVCLVPNTVLRQTLPDLGGPVATPTRLQISRGTAVVSEEPMYPRIYCLGGEIEKLRRHVENIPAAEKYAPVRSYLNSVSNESSFVDEAYTILTEQPTSYLDFPALHPADEIKIEITQTVDQITKPIWSTSFLIEDDSITTIILSQN